MPLSARSHIGRYEISAQIGAGGMGEVYRATDTKLGRTVAIKVLTESVAFDAERIARFKREATTLAALNHPNIAAIYGFEEADGVRALAMEFVDGPTLAERIAQGAIPVNEALPIARQIAEALDAAHEQGIIHRDLKPANIKVRPDGTVKVLDFGLAKAMDPARAISSNASQSPTITSAAMTEAGIILGTAAYMSPEQARGKTVDKRTDIWAFGVVLYEMLSGARPFQGEDATETLAAVVTRDPDWGKLPSNTPEAIRRLLHRCLRRESRVRLRDIADAQLDIEDALHSEEDPHRSSASRSRRLGRIAWISSLALALLIGAAVWSSRLANVRDTPPVEVRVPMVALPSNSPNSIALSPDGLKIVFEATADGRSQLWVRFLDTGIVRPLSGTENGYRPFWSPDNRSIGFFSGGWLRRIELDGGGVQPLAASSLGLGGAWSRSGTIVFASNGPERVWRIDARGGTPTSLKGLECQWPHFLPDGHRFLCQSTEAGGLIIVADLDGSEPFRLRVGEFAVYGRERELVFAHRGTLFTQEFDPGTLALSGDPRPLAEQVAWVSSSATGDLAYRSGTGRLGLGQAVWFNRKGVEIRRVGEPFEPSPGWDLSPDDRFLITGRLSGEFRIWIVDLERAAFSPFAGDGAFFGFWSADGERVIYTRNDGKNGRHIYQRWRARGREDLLFSVARSGVPRDWSSDGRFLLFETFNDARPEDSDLLAFPLDRTGKRDGEPLSIAGASRFVEVQGHFSPNGRWVAYMSNESGRPEIYLRPFPGPGAAIPVSVDGGEQVRWRANGEELFYIAPDGALMAVPFRAPGDPGPPVRLFATHLWGRDIRYAPEWDVASDGQRFLLNVAQPVTSPISLVLHRGRRPH
jgi:serine/threonine protein kinase